MSFSSGLGSVVAGLINNGRSLPTIDLAPLLATINQNRDTNAGLINGLPAELQPLYDAYKASLGQAGDTLRSDTTNVGNDLLNKTTALYDPNSDAVKATLAALKQQDYSTLPGTLNALKSQLAATGGLSRGGASKAITSAVLNPASTYSQQALNVTADQLNKQQTNVQSALNKIASMDDNTAQMIFGMTKDQAANILQFGRNDLKDKLTALINNNDQATNAILGVQGIGANNAYQTAVTRGAQQTAIVNGLAQLPSQFQSDNDDQINRVFSLFGGNGGGTGSSSSAGQPGAMNNAGSTLLPAALSLL